MRKGREVGRKWVQIGGQIIRGPKGHLKEFDLNSERGGGCWGILSRRMTCFKWMLLADRLTLD